MRSSALSVIIGGGIFFKNSLTTQPSLDSMAVSQPWIEVVSPTIFELDASSTPIRELQTGDELTVGNGIQVSDTGHAQIHFPDGSVARLDASTTVTLDEATYDPQSEKLGVRITVAVGRV